MTRDADLLQRVLVPLGAGQHERIGMVRLLGFELVDLALFLADGSELVADPGAVVGALRASLERARPRERRPLPRGRRDG